MTDGGCRSETDFAELENHAAVQGRTGVKTYNAVVATKHVNFPARIYLEERTRKLDLTRQGFVARGFHCKMDQIFEE